MAYDEDLAERLREIVAGERGVTEKKMFGGLAFLINGHMSVSASGKGGLMLRVDPARTAELLARPKAEPFEMRGKSMDGWLRVDTAGMTDAKLREWAKLGVDYAKSLPPK